MSAAAPIASQTACPIHLLRTWSRPGARFPTYPGVEQFSANFGYRDFLQTVAGLRTRGSHNVLALSLYLPGFDITSERSSPHRHSAEPEPSAVYLGYLKRECEMQGQLFAGMNRIEQLSLRGSGTALLSNAQITSLMQHLRHCFQFAPDSIGVYTVEVDVAHLTAQRLDVLRRAGFNHVRLPFLDIAPMQAGPPDGWHMQRHALAGIDQLRAASFRSMHVDLLMGCVQQNLMMLSRALKVMIDARIDRIVLHDMASLIDSECKARSMVDALGTDLDASANLAQCMWQLDQAGYINIGMDHFVRPGDPLAVAQAQGRLHANLDGFSARADYDLIACGVGAISAIGAVYTQNVATLETYYDQIDGNALPIRAGIALGMDDVLRRAVMQMLMCNLLLSVRSIELAYPITFADYFAPELVALDKLALDGLLTLDSEWLSITAKGRRQIRSICQVFDRALSERRLAVA